LLFADVAFDCRVVVVGVGVGGFDAVHIAADEPADRLGDDLGVADR